MYIDIDFFYLICGVVCVYVELWGMLFDGELVWCYMLCNVYGMCVVVSDFGVIVVLWFVFDCMGCFVDIVFVYDMLVEYFEFGVYFGVMIG